MASAIAVHGLHRQQQTQMRERPLRRTDSSASRGRQPLCSLRLRKLAIILSAALVAFVSTLVTGVGALGCFHSTCDDGSCMTIASADEVTTTLVDCSQHTELLYPGEANSTFVTEPGST